jgi:hypothetical protein
MTEHRRAAPSLAYSSPLFGEPTDEGLSRRICNAFPELNDCAADGSRTAFPRRAKYLLPLHSMFLPSGRLGERAPHQPAYILPKPGLRDRYSLEVYSELPHLRLAATR